YRPEELFDGNGRLLPALAELAPAGARRMGANPHANGGRLRVDLDLPDFRAYALDVPRPATERHESTRQLGRFLRDIFMTNARQLQEGTTLPWRMPIASLNSLLTSTCWRNDHNGFSHQGPGLIDVLLSKKGTVSRIYLPPDANCLLSVADHCLRSRDYVNLIVIDKQPQLQWLDMDTARQHAAHGASVWDWAGNEHRGEPDVVVAAAGDIVTMEPLAAAWLA